MAKVLPLCSVLAAAVSLIPQPLSPSTPGTITWSRDVAPILAEHCQQCHRPGESAPFSLMSYEDAKRHARQIASATRSRYMPPWLPASSVTSKLSAEFVGENRLTPQQIDILSRWSATGATEGDHAIAAPAPETPSHERQLGQPDLILEASQPLQLPASGSDVFWNFVLKPELTATHFIRAIEIRAGDKRLVHHANLLVDHTRAARAFEKTPGHGFGGMDFNIPFSVFDPPAHFLFWKPGTRPYEEPPGFAWRLRPGDDLVLNAHLQPSGKPESIRPSVALYFTSDPPRRSPVLLQLEHDGQLSIPAGSKTFSVTDHLKLPASVDVLAVYPHAHYLGRSFDGWAILPDGTRRELIQIPEWDPNWQGVFRYKQPVTLPEGTTVWMRWQYDNSTANPRNPNRPPQRVVAGNNATDEMGHVWLQVIAHAGQDRPLQLEEAAVERRTEKYPHDPSTWLSLGQLRMARLDLQGSLTALTEAVHADPTKSQPHNLLGTALSRTGRIPEALGQFNEALRIDPSNTNARYNLVYALSKAHRYDEALTQIETVQRAVPQDTAVENLWGELLVATGHKEDALEHFNRALQLQPGNMDAIRNKQALTQ